MFLAVGTLEFGQVKGEPEKMERENGRWSDWCALDLVSVPLCYTQ